MPAANLTDAADTTYARVSLVWTANTIRTKVAAFIVAAAIPFSDTTPNDRPVLNWLVPLTALSTQMTANADTPLPQAMFNAAVDYIYRMCFAGAFAQSAGRITNAQAAALLAAWNANF